MGPEGSDYTKFRLLYPARHNHTITPCPYRSPAKKKKSPSLPKRLPLFSAVSFGYHFLDTSRSSYLTQFSILSCASKVISVPEISLQTNTQKKLQARNEVLVRPTAQTSAIFPSLSFLFLQVCLHIRAHYLGFALAVQRLVLLCT